VDCALQNKVVGITPPAALIDNAAVTTAAVDTLGYTVAEIYVYIGATDIALTALKLQECDTSGGTYTDIDGTVYGTDTDISGAVSTLPSATDDNKIFKFEVDLLGRKRFLDLNATVGDGTTGAYVTAWAVLSAPSEMALTASDRGYGNILRV
jgi:hypothetical protein